MSKLKSPGVSVVMPVYNREKYVADAIKSILNQSFTDLEFIIIDDGSNDSTYDILQSFNDKRIRIIRKDQNRGNYSARNEGMKMAKGKYICVMDSDDVALPDRIQVQYSFMEANKQIGLCGGLAKNMNSSVILNKPEDYDEIKVWSLSNIMFLHPTVFVRTEYLKKFNLKYNDNYRYAGDYDFLVRAAQFFPVTNMQKVLLELRTHPEQISVTDRSGQLEVAGEVILSQLNHFELDISEKEKCLHLALMRRIPIKSENEFGQLKEWANFLLKRNNKTNFYNADHLANFLKSLLKYVLKEFRISENEGKVFKDTIQQINRILRPDIPLPFGKEWAILPDFVLKLIDVIKEKNSLKIVECGSGLSTLIFGYLAKEKMVNHIVSLEHNKQFYETTKLDIEAHGLEKYITLIYAPLKQIQINNVQWQWYDLSVANDAIGQIDLLLVDGPPGYLQKHSRYPAIPMLKKFFNQNTTIILDDSIRPDEQEIIERWLLENPELEVNELRTRRGMCIMTSKPTNKCIGSGAVGFYQ